jgi:L-fuconolactonase
MTLVVDAHQHFWDPSRAFYPWMTEELTAIRRSYGPDDLRPLLAERGVDRSILVQTRSSLAETEEFLATAAATDFIGGVVGWVDLTDPKVGEVLATLQSRPDGHKLRGIRHQVHDEPDAQWLVRPTVRTGLAAVEQAGLVFDLLVRPRELPAALETVRRFPGLRFVIDHIAKPSIRTKEFEPWSSRLAPFAELPNVWCKLSGMSTEAEWANWSPDDLVPYVRRVLDWFGPERLLFGSDWPVCLLDATYAQVFDALAYAVRDLPSQSREHIFGGTAADVYRVDSGG